MDIQALLFLKSIWTTDAARSWLKSHGYKPIKHVHTTKNYYRYRLKPVKKNGKYRIKFLGNGIKAVIIVK